MDSLGLEPESVDNLDMYSHIPPVLMEKCAALSVRPDTVKNLIQSMQGQWQQQLHIHIRETCVALSPELKVTQTFEWYNLNACGLITGIWLHVAAAFCSTQTPIPTLTLTSTQNVTSVPFLNPTPTLNPNTTALGASQGVQF